MMARAIAIDRTRARAAPLRTSSQQRCSCALISYVNMHAITYLLRMMYMQNMHRYSVQRASVQRVSLEDSTEEPSTD